MTAPEMPQVGEKAPEFKLPAFPGDEISLKQFRGKKHVVLYFYPRDNTPGCTTEACDFRDQLGRLEKSDVAVLGVSTDTLESHQKFTEKFSLTFPLLADIDHKLAEKYGVWVEKNMYGKKSMGILRSTFLIDQKGKVAAVWKRVKVKGHVDQVLEKIDELTN